MRGDGDRDLVIDTGMGVANLHEAAQHLFGKAVSAVATHIYIDHIGSLHEFADRIVDEDEAESVARASDNFSMLRDEHPLIHRLARKCRIRGWPVFFDGRRRTPISTSPASAPKPHPRPDSSGNGGNITVSI